MPANALTELQITIAKWKNPSAWDHIRADEPLDPIKGEWVENYACNVTSDGTITIPAGTVFTNATGGLYICGNEPGPITVGLVHQEEDRATFESIRRALDSGRHPGVSMGTAAPGQNGRPSTASPYDASSRSSGTSSPGWSVSPS